MTKDLKDVLIKKNEKIFGKVDFRERSRGKWKEAVLIERKNLERFISKRKSFF